MLNKYILFTLITFTAGNICADTIIDEKLLAQYQENLSNSKLYCVGSLVLPIILKMLPIPFEQQSILGQCTLLSGSVVIPVAAAIYCIEQSTKYWALHNAIHDTNTLKSVLDF